MKQPIGEPDPSVDTPAPDDTSWWSAWKHTVVWSIVTLLAAVVASLPQVVDTWPGERATHDARPTAGSPTHAVEVTKAFQGQDQQPLASTLYAGVRTLEAVRNVTDSILSARALREVEPLETGLEVSEVSAGTYFRLRVEDVAHHLRPGRARDEIRVVGTWQPLPLFAYVMAYKSHSGELVLLVHMSSESAARLGRGGAGVAFTSWVWSEAQTLVELPIEALDALLSARMIHIPDSPYVLPWLEVSLRYTARVRRGILQAR